MTYNQVPQHVNIGAGENRVSVDLFLKISFLAGDFTKLSKLSTHPQPLHFYIWMKHRNCFTHPLQSMCYIHDMYRFRVAH
jgi:hypothetical protein